MCPHPHSSCRIQTSPAGPAAIPTIILLSHFKGCMETNPPVLFPGVSAGLIDSPSPSFSYQGHCASPWELLIGPPLWPLGKAGRRGTVDTSAGPQGQRWIRNSRWLRGSVDHFFRDISLSPCLAIWTPDLLTNRSRPDGLTINHFQKATPLVCVQCQNCCHVRTYREDTSKQWGHFWEYTRFSNIFAHRKYF